MVWSMPARERENSKGQSRMKHIAFTQVGVSTVGADT